MEKITLNQRNITIIASYLLITAVFFALGILIGYRNGSEPVLQEVSTTANNIPDSTLFPLNTQIPSNYRVILEDGELRLYFDENGISRLVSSEKISEDTYPVSDIATLKKGLVFDSIDNAISLMENFIS